MIEINRNPTPREIAVFGGLVLLFFGLVGGVVLWRPAGLVGAAAILGLAWLASLVFNREERVGQLAGAALPALFGLAGGAVQLAGVEAWAVAAALWVAGALVAAVVWASRETGRRIYVAWMLAAAPIGWTISHVVLGAVYYLVLTPIGLILRLSGHDPLRRSFDRAASSYWIERKQDRDRGGRRYFKQF